MYDVVSSVNMEGQAVSKRVAAPTSPVATANV